MSTQLQDKGDYGEIIVIKHCFCPRCKREKTLRRLKRNFESADLICNFCGFTAQVKTAEVKDIETIPSAIISSAWEPIRKRMEVGIYISLYIVLIQENNWGNFTINYLPSELQHRDMFKPRNKLSDKAKRKGWQGYTYKFTDKDKTFISKIYPYDN